MTELSTTDWFWLAGLLEGEGSFLSPPPSSPNCPAISLQMTDEDIVKLVSKMLDVSYHSFTPKNTSHKKYYFTSLRGTRAVKVMETLFPLLGERRRSQITRAIDQHDPTKIFKGKNAKRKLVVEQVSEILDFFDEYRDAPRLPKGKLEELSKRYNVSGLSPFCTREPLSGGGVYEV